MPEAGLNEETVAADENEVQLTGYEQFFSARFICEEVQWLQSIAERHNLQNLSQALGLVITEAEAMSGKSNAAEQRLEAKVDRELKG